MMAFLRFFLPLLLLVVASPGRSAALPGADGMRLPWQISLQTGGGYSALLNMGVAPATDPGLCLAAGIGYGGAVGERWVLELSATAHGGLYVESRELTSASAGLACLQVAGLRRLSAADARLRFAAGAALRESLLLYYNDNLQNAALGAGSFTDLALLGSMRYGLGARRVGVARMLHAGVGVAPLSAQLTPGFAYIDNYTAQRPVTRNYFDDYEWHLKPFGSWEGRIGMDWLFFSSDAPAPRCCSALSLDYQWLFLTTGRSARHRLDLVYHSLLLSWSIPTSGRHPRIRKRHDSAQSQPYDALLCLR